MIEMAVESLSEAGKKFEKKANGSAAPVGHGLAELVGGNRLPWHAAINGW
jgi:hypothetical protein